MATIQLFTVVPRLEPSIKANALSIFNTPAPTMFKTNRLTIELLWSKPVTIAPPPMASNLLVVCFFKNSLNLRPAKMPKVLSIKFIASRKKATPASIFQLSIDEAIIN